MTQKEIKENLKGMSKEELDLALNMIAQALMFNGDIFFWMIQDKRSDFEVVLSEELERRISIKCPAEYSEKEEEIMERLMDDSFWGRITKAKATDTIADILSSDLFFEAICTVTGPEDDIMSGLMDELGLWERFREVSEDPVCKNRREYLTLISDYIYAAVNLYGAVSVVDLCDIIMEYERGFRGKKGYTRGKGIYKDTVLFDPEKFSIATVMEIVKTYTNGADVSLDGIVMHEVFRGDLIAEEEEFGNYVEGLDTDNVTDEHLIDFFSDKRGTSFRELLRTAGEKDMYLPDKKTFLRFADPIYRDNLNEDRAIRMFFLSNFREELEIVKEEDYYGSVEDVAEILSDEIWELCNGRDTDYEGVDPAIFLEDVMDMLEEYDITFEGIDQVNEFLKYLMDFSNSTRLWVNNGHTPVELLRLYPHSENPKIVAGSSDAARILAEGKTYLEGKGFEVDLEEGADTVPVYPERDGKIIPFTATTRKIYPNDTCPCGSGKKYKNCCGRK